MCIMNLRTDDVQFMGLEDLILHPPPALVTFHPQILKLPLLCYLVAGIGLINYSL